ncbi:MAG: ketosteroid isomerase [Alphaproteobacteria bacterium]|nr:ketosteroid isomerase [Alphaproteobacteria bacterium]
MKLREEPHSDDLAAVKTWFADLSVRCRAVDYEGARPLFSDDMIAFGTFTDFMIGQELAEREQWRNVWGTIRKFDFDPAKIHAIVSADRLTAIGMGVWTSDGFHPNGDRFDRPGRTTVALARRAVGQPFVATHTHMSLYRGTPERSYGRFTGP